MSKITVIAAVVDTMQLRLYKEDGSTYDIPQGDARLKPILTEIMPLLEAGLKAEVQIIEPVIERDTTYADYEKQSSGFTRFFRVAKAKLVSLVMGEDTPYVAPVRPMTVGMVPGGPNMSAAVADIMAHAKPVDHSGFDPDHMQSDETIVAIVGADSGNASIVPGMENLKGHISHAVKNQNTKGMEAFLKRLGAAIKNREHTVDDVLRFMEKGDLPLADDGCIIAYKVLTSEGQPEGTFVDCHSRKVTQRVGSYVHQDEKLVNKSRRTECATGLHIARRGYVKGFGGDIIVMVKFRPEDVIAVPLGEPDKIRVCGYHIIGKIPKDEHARLRRNEPMASDNGLKMLTMAIRGEHIGVIEIVRITEAKGGGVIVTPVAGAENVKPQIQKGTAKTQAVETPKPIEPRKLDAPKVDPKAVSNKVTADRLAKTAPPTKAEQARLLYTMGKLGELKKFKRDSKKSYKALGFTPEEEGLIVDVVTDSPVTNGHPPVKGTNGKNGTPPKNPTIKDDRPFKAAKTVVEGKPKRTVEVGSPRKKVVAHPSTPHVPNAATAKVLNQLKAPTPKELNMSGTRAEVARQLFDQAAAGDKSRWGSLWRHQKECKKSWTILGFNQREIERIKVNKPDWA